MHIRTLKKEYTARLYVLLGFMLAGMVLLLGVLFRLQVTDRLDYERRLERQSVRRVRIPGPRGRIFDRNGFCLADNRPACNIVVYLEELRQPTRRRTLDRVMEVLEAAGREIGVPPEVDRAAVERHIVQQLSLPLTIWSDVSREMLSCWAERASAYPGMDLQTGPMREYSYGRTLAHTLGYTGRADIPREENPYHYYLPDVTGKAGLERVFDRFLSGEAGGRLLQIDVTGFRHRELAVRPAREGGDLRLTLDLPVQKAAERALGDDSGAVVVLNPNNGDVLAMASAPGFDLNDFIPAIPYERWNELRSDPDHPLLNRAVAGAYPPGSIFKPVVALAALQQKPAESQEVRTCRGAFRLGNRVFHCWNRSGHGPLTLRQAIESSCNVYMYEMALECGPELILANAAALGLGDKTGVEVDYEQAGVLPTAEWLAKNRRGSWTDGDTCNLSIGQGYLVTTPLQMAMVTATLANGGWLYKPRLVLASRASLEKNYVFMPVRNAGRMNWLPESLELVRLGMRDVIMSPHGTARTARVDGLVYAGKTGTAEIGVKGSGRKRGWMIAFAPYDDPQVAVAMVVDEADSGGSTVGPKMKKLMEGLFGEGGAYAG